MDAGGLRRAQVGPWPPGPCFQASSPLPLPLPLPHPLPPTCRSLSAVGLFLGFLVKASLRKWWKFWVLVGTRAPTPQAQVSPHAGHSATCPLPSLQKSLLALPRKEPT